MRPARLAALSLALLLVAASAGAGPIPGTLTLRASTGLADSKLDGWNKPLQDYSDYAQMNFDPLGPSLRSQAELTWRPVRAFSIGVAGSFQKVKSYEIYEYPGNTTADDRLSISLQRVTGRLAWWPARLPGAYVGGEVGTATAEAKDAFGIRLLDGTAYRYADAWSGTSTIYGAFVGAERRIGRHGLLGYVEFGWDFQSMGQLGDSRYDPSFAAPVVGSPAGAPAIKTDFSGAHVMFGLGWSLGRRD